MRPRARRSNFLRVRFIFVHVLVIYLHLAPGAMPFRMAAMLSGLLGRLPVLLGCSPICAR
jgi:hypothetical protein